MVESRRMVESNNIGELKNVPELTIAHCLRRAVELRDISDSPRLDVELLLADLLGKPRTWLYTWPEKPLSNSQFDNFESALARRRAGEPIAHILGRREFWSLSLRVDNSTLIPRPDSERLVELALERAPVPLAGNALDLGTGTGALALAFASERPSWSVVGLDFSADAVALAQSNARELELDNVHFARSHWFDILDGEKRFNVILANPPYIADDDPHLELGDVRFEPRSALVAQNDGLADLEHIVGRAPDYLAQHGWLLLEHGWEQGENVRALLIGAGFVEVTTYRDLGGQERVTLGRIQ